MKYLIKKTADNAIDEITFNEFLHEIKSLISEMGRIYYFSNNKMDILQILGCYKKINFSLKQ
jgi:hypothetical protein